MTIKTLLKKATQTIDQLDAELIVAHVLKQTREYVLSHPEKKLCPKEWISIHILFYKRKKGIPLAYITKTKPFFGLDFLVNKHTLIPRPDTELLVEQAIKRLKTLDKPTLVDLGTGSGCIPIAIGNTIKDIAIIATDISKQALRVAQKNAQTHGVDIAFAQGSLLDPIFSLLTTEQKPLVITANLPYLTKHQFDTEKSIQHEPYTALVAENLGLALYYALIKQIKILHIHRSPITCFIEIDPEQTHYLVEYIKEELLDTTVHVHKDLAGLNRLVEISLKLTI
ncbi:peptide chain release factor N(5)-glutamine methyltransferase [Patescibacteria group bacterium]|nr:peptide chain release factor N(5)-glutamine methyltransferase [Patescibacteria group bacterium]MBU1721187.1 peptide chain release factor N(5)-glutamine methyltransferase [Patescibacteria group bacterium]MBU1901105.1 peptide chain release factor N(5)-glutamine methyltransferase [Patescibacteria group bacterium]